MKILTALIFCCIGFVGIGCKDSTTTEPPIVQAHDSMSYQIGLNGLRPFRTGEYLFMWVKIAPDTGWITVSMPEVHDRYFDGSAYLIGKFYSEQPLDSVKDVLFTLEQTLSPITPGLPLVRGGALVFDSTRTHITTTLDSKATLGAYASLQASLVFTSPSPDTTAYRHEFYLMNLQGNQQLPSLLSLNAVPAGWKYGLWVVDTNFTPHQAIFYGLFTSAEGHDSDSTNDHYAYPGGSKPQRMDMPSGSIYVTLEPEFYGDSLKFRGPSSFILMEFKRFQSIVKDRNYTMMNVSAFGIPQGTITLRKN